MHIKVNTSKTSKPFGIDVTFTTQGGKEISAFKSLHANREDRDIHYAEWLRDIPSGKFVNKWDRSPGRRKELLRAIKKDWTININKTVQV